MIQSSLWKKLTAGAAVVMLSVGLSACSGKTDTPTSTSEPSSTSTTADSGSNSAAFPVTIKTALGDVEIPKQPTRVVTLGWGSAEASVALGVVPLGMPDMSRNTEDGSPILPWVKEKLNGQTPELFKGRDIPFEQIAALKPEVILAVQSGLKKEEYDKLSAIAPTVAYKDQPWQTSWQDQALMVGQALGKEDEAKKLIEQTNAKFAKVKAEHPEFAGKTVVAASATTAENLNIYLDSDPRVELLKEMGLTPLPKIAELSKVAKPGRWSAPVSWENLPDYQGDILVGRYLSPDLQKQVEGNSIFQSLKAVKDGAYIALENKLLALSASSPNVLNVDWMLEHYVPMLTKAAKAAEGK